MSHLELNYRRDVRLSPSVFLQQLQSRWKSMKTRLAYPPSTMSSSFIDCPIHNDQWTPQDTPIDVKSMKIPNPPIHPLNQPMIFPRICDIDSPPAPSIGASKLRLGPPPHLWMKYTVLVCFIMWLTCCKHCNYYKHCSHIVWVINIVIAELPPINWHFAVDKWLSYWFFIDSTWWFPWLDVKLLDGMHCVRVAFK